MVLDERGKEATSEGFAELLAKVHNHKLHCARWSPCIAVLVGARSLSVPARDHAHACACATPEGAPQYRTVCCPGQAGDNGRPSIAFCIGGPHGHSSEVRGRANVMLRLSGCVLNHQVSSFA